MHSKAEAVHGGWQVISTLRGHDDKVRVVLNKSDQVDMQQLMRVYGALMWSLGKVFRSPEVGALAPMTLACFGIGSILYIWLWASPVMLYRAPQTLGPVPALGHTRLLVRDDVCLSPPVAVQVVIALSAPAILLCTLGTNSMRLYCVSAGRLGTCGKVP